MKKFFWVIVAIAAMFCAMADASAASVKELMVNAFMPVGKCLYVYGGAWNEEDTAAGIEALSYGVSPQWIDFYNRNNSNYNYKNTRYQIHNGLDCTGYVGWCMYQIFGTSYSDNGYVCLSRNMTQEYTTLFNGQFTAAGNVKDYQCGDIMSSRNHAYIALGQCSDKSLVLLHASPPAVSLCGTHTPSGNADSEAVKLAKYYMKKFFTQCYEKYPNCIRGASYLTEYNQMRWNSSVLPDPDGYRNMRVENILWDLFENVKLYSGGQRILVEAQPYIEGGDIYIPLITGAELFGAQVNRSGDIAEILYNGEDVTINGWENTLSNGNKKVSGKVSYSNGVPMVSARSLAELLGGKVYWEEISKSVTLQPKK